MTERADELELARRSAERFAREVVGPRASALEREPRSAVEVLAGAAELGLVALGDGAETGVLARRDGATDLALGNVVLQALATTSAGFAFLVLVQGLASWVAAALAEGALTSPAALVLPRGVLCWGGSLASRAFVVERADEAGAARVRAGPPPCRPVHVLGLREAHPKGLADPWAEDRAVEGAVATRMALTIDVLAALGGTAIAAGLARGALAEAALYAGERFQGGALIGELPVVREMLALAARRRDSIALLAEAQVARLHGAESAEELEAARTPARAAFASAADACVECVTTSLQVLGGYGYMADFGLERRFRDAHALRLAIGGARPPAWRGSPS